MRAILSASTEHERNDVRTFTDLAELEAAVGEELGTTDWLEITQERVDAFADATDDHQWIHVDVERAKAGPFGGTIAHGYLTLSLIPRLSSQLFSVETAGAAAQLRPQQGPLPQPGQGRRPDPRPRRSLGRAHRRPCRQADGHPLHDRDRGRAKPACVAEMVVLCSAQLTKRVSFASPCVGTVIGTPSPTAFSAQPTAYAAAAPAPRRCPSARRSA